MRGLERVREARGKILRAKREAVRARTQTGDSVNRPYPHPFDFAQGRLLFLSLRERRIIFIVHAPMIRAPMVPGFYSRGPWSRRPVVRGGLLFPLCPYRFALGS